MTDITPENVARILDGVTPGPWHVDGPPWNQTIYSSSENRVAFLAHSNGLDDDRDIATARFIAWAREAVPALSARLAQEQKDVGIQIRHLNILASRLADMEAEREACAPYLKDGETPVERIEREFNDCIMLMGMLANGRTERDAAMNRAEAADARVEKLREALANAAGALDSAGEELSDFANILSRDPWQANHAYESAVQARAVLQEIET